MVFVRKIKKGNKSYEYIYKSERVNGKVKSIYVGKKDIPEKNSSKDDFEAILIKINKNIKDNDINNANEMYNKLLKEYNKMKVEDKERIEFFNKTKEIYDKLNELNENS